jgi:16S rRNA A1518/A1519 N6-dimethyltransferase RsmA/KsgA/DIM1 with predicted DNA glycosylase/AP lyase activity
MHPRFEELNVPQGGFLRFLRQVFALKRKTLVNNLRAVEFTPAAVEAAFRQCAVDPQVRSEALSLESMACLFRALQDQIPNRNPG